MKICTKCEILKEDGEFNWRLKSKGTRQAHCKACHQKHDNQYWATSEHRRKSNGAANKQRRIRNARFIWEYLMVHPCKCGESDPTALDCDHRDPKTKRDSICELSRTSYSIAVLKEELDKCDVMCANCHRKRTAKQFGWYKFLHNQRVAQSD